MHPLATLSAYDLIQNAFIVVAMPLLIWANLRHAGLQSPLHAYLWREHPNLMRVALTILALTTLFSVITILAYRGVISPATEEALSMVVGVSFLFASLAMVCLAVGAAFKALRSWRAVPRS